MQKIVINMWFDDQAETAAKFYTSVFPDSSITPISYYPDAGQEVTGRKPGSVMTVLFELNAQSFIALNGGPHDFAFNEAISLMLPCETQTEIDHYWQGLTADGGSESQCGWLKDKFGVSWQVAPPVLDQLLSSPDPAVANRVMEAMLKMKKIEIATLQAAAHGA